MKDWFDNLKPYQKVLYCIAVMAAMLFGLMLVSGLFYLIFVCNELAY